MNFYGDDTRWFVARVIDWEDDYRGRVKIRVLGLHSEDVADEDLPWAKCVLPTTEGGTSGIGKIPQVLNGAFVFGMFLDGSMSQMPIVLGSMTQFELPSSTQRLQIAETGRPSATVGEYNLEGVILDPNLEQMWDDGKANLETRAVIIMQFLLDAGIASAEAAAGVVGNLIQESTLDPTALNSIGAFGLAQWTPSSGRLQLFQQWAAKNFPAKSNEDFFVQLYYLVYDMKNSRGHAVWNNLSDKKIAHKFKVEEPISKQNFTNATWLVLKKYEVPGNYEIELPKRQDHAEFAYYAYDESKKQTAAYAALSAGAG